MHSPFLFDDFKVTYKTFFQDFKESSEIVYVKRRKIQLFGQHLLHKKSVPNFINMSSKKCILKNQLISSSNFTLKKEKDFHNI